MHSLAFAMTGMRSLPGGIAAVNENLVLALGELVHRGEMRLEIDSLLEGEAHRPHDLPLPVEFRGFAGSKRDLALRLYAHALSQRWILYERVGLAAGTAPLAALGLARTIVFAHSPENWRDVKPRHLQALRGARLVVTNSEYTLRRMQSNPALAGRFRGVACPLGLPPKSPLHTEIPMDDGGPLELGAVDGTVRPLGGQVLLLVGRIDPTEREKGHDRLIAALPALRARHPHTQLVLAGPGDDRARLEGLARAAGVGCATFLPGSVSDELLGRLYRRCFAFTMPSRQEGFGLVYLEAMNYGKPCLGSREDGAEDVIVDGETGLLVADPTQPDEIAGALTRLLDDPGHAAEMGRRGFERLHRKFTAEQFRRRFMEAVRGAMGG